MGVLLREARARYKRGFFSDARGALPCTSTFQKAPTTEYGILVDAEGVRNVDLGGANLTWRSPVVTVGFEAIGKGRSDARLSIELRFLIAHTSTVVSAAVKKCVT